MEFQAFGNGVQFKTHLFKLNFVAKLVMAKFSKLAYFFKIAKISDFFLNF